MHQLELETQNEELRTARLEIETGLARYTELFQFAPIGYVVVDADGLVRAMNLASVRMLGPKSALVGATFLLFVEGRQHSEFRDLLRRTLTRQAQAERNETCELRLSPHGKDAFDVRLTASMIDGRVTEVLLAIEDVTAQNRAEAALHREVARRDDFMAVLSHELRNPLSPIRSSLSLLDITEPGSAEGRKALTIIERQVAHLTRIVDDLLDVARSARGLIALQCEHIQIADAVRRAVDDHRASFAAGGVALDLECRIEPAWVNADPTRLVQVVGNLLANALKFTPPGGRVDVVLGIENGMAVLSVRDNGSGIEPGMSAHLFEPFVQGRQNIDRNRGGLGLGLAMVKELMRLHGGTAEATSAGLGRGAEFTVRWPLSRELPQASPPAPIAQARGQRVLVIEDNTDTAEALAALLAHHGHEVHVAFDGCAGVEQARAQRPDVILCDLGLPGMDGYDVARTIRADRTLDATYLIAMSGYARPEDRKCAAEAGFDQHIAKPPTLAQLRELGRPSYSTR